MSLWKLFQPEVFNSLPDYKILGLSKLKAIADDNLNVTQNIQVVFHRIENIVRKEENADNQHWFFSITHHVFYYIETQVLYFELRAICMQMLSILSRLQFHC